MLLAGSDAITPLVIPHVMRGMGDVFDWQVSIESWQAGVWLPAVRLCRKPSEGVLAHQKNTLSREGRCFPKTSLSSASASPATWFGDKNPISVLVEDKPGQTG